MNAPWNGQISGTVEQLVETYCPTDIAIDAIRAGLPIVQRVYQAMSDTMKKEIAQTIENDAKARIAKRRSK